MTSTHARCGSSGGLLVYCVMCILTIYWAGHTICSFCRSDDLRWVVHGCIDRRALALVFSFVSIAHVDTFAMALSLHD